MAKVKEVLLDGYEISKEIGVSKATLARWYRAKNEDMLDEELAKLLPNPTLGGIRGTTHLWTKADIEKLMKFRMKLKFGDMKEYNTLHP